jgi:hypothetical protein
MKALVLSGGAGTRPGPITRASAEQLVPAAAEPLPLHGPESLADAGITDVGTVAGDTAAETGGAAGDGSNSCPWAACIPRGNPPGPARAALTAPAVRYPADSRSDACRTVVRGCRQDTGGAVGLPGAGHRARTLLACDAPRGTALDALACAGPRDDLELGRPRPESAHGDGRDAGLPVPAHHRARGRPGEIRGAGRDRLEHVEDREGHGPRRSADRTEAGDELGHRPRLVADRAAYPAVGGAETDEERATPSPEDPPPTRAPPTAAPNPSAGGPCWRSRPGRARWRVPLGPTGSTALTSCGR